MHYWINPNGELYYTNCIKVSSQEVIKMANVMNYKEEIVHTRKILSEGWIGVYPNYFTDKQNAIISKLGFFNPTERQIDTLSELCVAASIVVYADFEDTGIVTLHVPTLKFVADEWYLSEVSPIVEGDKHV